jgi:hypothetical protein
MRPVEIVVPEGSLLRRVPEAGGRLYRDHPAHDRRDLLAWRGGRARAGGGQRLRHDQRALHRGQARQRPALGDVLVLRRRAWRQHPEGDGLNHGNAPISTATIPPMEILEAAYPVMFRQWALRPTARARRASRRAGRGLRDRGAGGERREAFLFGERGRFAPQGVAGGGDGGDERVLPSNRRRLARPPLASKMRGIKLEQGPGACGSRHPAAAATARREPTRRPRRVARDVALGYLTADRGRPPMAPAGGRQRMSRRMIGVDVGGTFTDVFFWTRNRGAQGRQGADHPARPVGRLSRRHRHAGDGSVGVATGRARHHRRHQRAAGAQGREGRRHHHRGLRDVLEMRRRDRPRTWGLRGDFDAGGAARPAPGGARAHAGRRHRPHGAVDLDAVRARRRLRCWSRLRGGRVLFANAYANPENEAARSPRCARSGPTPMSRQPRDPARDPRVRALLHHRAQRLSAARGRRATSTGWKPR